MISFWKINTDASDLRHSDAQVTSWNGAESLDNNFKRTRPDKSKALFQITMLENAEGET